MAGGCGDLQPETWDALTFLEKPPEGNVFFLKHSLGAKGNGVHVMDRASLLQRLAAGQREGFIVQRCVAPAALKNGRKWVVRAHALLHAVKDEVRLYLHQDAICLEYGQVFTDRLEVRAAHISNCAKLKHMPKPELLNDEVLISQLEVLVARAFGAVRDHMPSGPFSPEATELCQVFGLDVIWDDLGKAWLLEINDYPAIASGTMEHVDTEIYTRLVRDLLRLVVLPKLDGVDPVLGGWRKIWEKPS